MFGVRPIIPWVYAPTFHIPMSSPKMTRMFGFFCGGGFCCASAGTERHRASAREMHLEGTNVMENLRRGPGPGARRPDSARRARGARPPHPGPEARWDQGPTRRLRRRAFVTRGRATDAPGRAGPLERVQEESGPELRLEPGRLGGHDLPGVADLQQLLHRGGPERERRPGLAPVDTRLKLARAAD